MVMVNWHISDYTLLYAITFLNLFGPSTRPLLLNDNWLLNIKLLYPLFKNFKKITFHNWLNLEIIVCRGVRDLFLLSFDTYYSVFHCI